MCAPRPPSAIRIAGALLALALLIAPVGVRPAAGRPAAPSPSRAATPDLDRLSGDLEALSRRVGPAVVQIFINAVVPATGDGESPGSPLSHQRGIGSGVIVDPIGF